MTCSFYVRSPKARLGSTHVTLTQVHVTLAQVRVTQRVLNGLCPSHNVSIIYALMPKGANGRKEERKCKGCYESGEFFILLDDVVVRYLSVCFQTNKSNGGSLIVHFSILFTHQVLAIFKTFC